VRRNRILAPLVSLAAASLLLAAPASARKVIAPPGNAGVGQYVEVVPGAGGSTPVGSHSSHGPVLTPGQRQRLEAAGRSGKALASFVQRTGVARGKASSSPSHAGAQAEHGHMPGAGRGSSNGGSGGSLPSAVPASATRSAGGGLGWGLPAALGAIAFAAAGIALARRRAA
jgi:hypothetical protein